MSDDPNPILQPLVDALRHIRGHNKRTNLSEEFNLKSLISGEQLKRYYRYDGSLTTPPCYESVIWSVLLDPLKLSLPQLHAFRYLHDEKADVIANTYRAVQPLRTRILFRSFFSKDIQDDLKQRMENNGKYLIINMKLMMILISLLMIIF